MMLSTSCLNQEERNWLDLPSDVMANILNRIGIADILENAQKVCTVWREICKNPVMWRVVNMKDFRVGTSVRSSIHGLWSVKIDAPNILFKQVVDRSQGQLVDITIVRDFNAELFLYAADRSSQLRRLEMASCITQGSLTTDALMKFPLLEELNLYAIEISQEEMETVCRYCPMLKTLKVNKKVPRFWKTFSTDEGSLKCLNAMAIAIGQNLVELRHLELIANNMTNIGLEVILNNCHHLEALDLRACFNIDLNGDLGKKCYQQIKHLKLPKDSLDGCSYYYEIVIETSDDDDYYNYDDYYDYEDYYTYKDYDFDVYGPHYFSD